MRTATHRPLGRWILGLFLAFLLVACGGGSESEAPASRIEVGPQGALLVGSGATRSLTAQLFDAAGTPVSGSVVWSSSDPAIVTVDTNGTLRAVAVGTARITAAVGALKSIPALVTVAQPTAGARLLADSQIVSGPTPVNAAAAPAAGNAYEVVLRGVPALAVGTIVIASEAANVAGRVLSVQPEGADQRVQLLSVPPNQLFTAFDFRDSVDLSQGPFEIPADLAASYDVTQTGSTFVFTPKRAAPSSSGRARIHAATGTRALPPLPPFKECEATTGFGSGLPLPLALSAPPSFQVTLDGAVERTANASGTRIAVTASPVFNFTSVLQITSAFEAKVGCKLTLVKRKFRAPGWAGLFFGGDVEFGVGFEVGGKVTLASATVGGTAELKPTLAATLDCPVNANCGLTGNVTAVTDVKPVFTTPSIEQLRFEPGVSLFAFLALEAGNADVEQLQFKAIEIKAGVDLTASLTPEVLQIANADPILGRSQYSLAFKGDIGPGIKLGEFLTFAGLSEVVPLKLEFGLPLGRSPTAASVAADQARYLPGQRATVTVKLAPESVRFPSGLIYNVKTVQLRRSTGAISTELLAEQTAADGQTDFVLGFDSPGLIDASDIVAFVDTRVLAFLPLVLEIGSAASARINATLPAQISTSASLDVTVEVPAGNGQFAPAPNMLVDFTPTCATVNPTSGRTNASGVIATTVTPNAACTSVSVDAVARADVGTAALAQKTVTASVFTRILSGQLTLNADFTYPGEPAASHVSTVSIFLTAKMDGNGTFQLQSVTGTGSHSITYNANLNVSCNESRSAVGRPPDTINGVVSPFTNFSSVRNGETSAQGEITPQVVGTKSTGFCGDPTWVISTRAYDGNLNDGTTGTAAYVVSFIGRSIVSNGSTIAIDYNRDFTDDFGRRTITTGRLE